MKNIIMLYKDRNYEFDDLEEIINLFFGDEYNNLSKEEKFIERYKKSFGICKLKNIDLIDTRIGTLGDNGEIVTKDYNVLNSFIINNEKTYILSICKFDDAIILEKSDSYIFNNKGINTNKQGNYIVINKYIDEILLINLNNF